MSELRLRLADREGLRWAQEAVTRSHYLHRPVDTRCSCLAYLVLLNEERVGCLIFGRPEATRCTGWFGSVEDVRTGRCRITRWQVLNLARVWLDPIVQHNGRLYVPSAATQVIAQALRRVPYDYLVARPPCFLDEPWLITEVLSYCQSDLHRGTVYRAANFRLVSENSNHIQTYVRKLRGLTTTEKRTIEKLGMDSYRSRRYRSARAVAMWEQAPLFAPVLAQGGT